MAVRIQVPKKAALVRFVLHPWGRAFLIGFVLLLPWMLGRLMTYTTYVLGDLGRYAK